MKNYTLKESITLQKKQEEESIHRNYTKVFDSITCKKKINLGKFSDNSAYNALKAVTVILKIKVQPNVMNNITNASNIEAMADHIGIPIRHVQMDENFSNYVSGVFYTTLDSKEVVIFHKMRSCFVYECDSGKVYKYKPHMKISKSVLQFYKPFTEPRMTLKGLGTFACELMGMEILIFLGLSFFLSLLALAVPIAMNYLVGEILPEANTSLLLEYSIGLFVFGLGSALFFASKSLILLKIEGKLTYYVETAAWYRILNFPMKFFEKYKSADIAMRASAADSIRKILTGSVISSLFSGMFSIVGFIALCYFSWKIALIIGGMILIFQLAYFPLVFKQVKVMKKFQDHFGSLVSDGQENINNIQKIKSSCSENRILDRFIKSNRKQVELRYKFQRYNNFESMGDIAFSSSIYVVVYTLVATVFKVGSEFSLGDFIAFNSILGTFVGSFIGMMKSIVHFVEIKPYLERFKPIMDQEVESDNNYKSTPSNLCGDIEFKNVSFKYSDGDRNIIDDVSLVIKKGEYVAITGASGSGKSTLLKLLMGFKLPDSGDITYNSYSLSDVNLHYLRLKLGVVLQKTELFDSDIYTNIRMNMPVGMPEVEEAVKLAGLERDIENLPMGLFTVLQANGASLSGGQRQRISIARALIRKPEFLYFDEATSSLDNITQSIVTKTILDLNITRVVIAHRLSTIKHADKIIVLDQGKITKMGTFEEIYGQKIII